jgi:hypothetical protein
MKLFWAAFLFFAIASISYATTLEEVAHLSKLNTSDDLILQLLQENPVKTSVGPADVIFLKEQGVSEQVIGYIWTAAKSEKAILPPQDGESISLGEGLRAYYVLTDDGQRKMVVTNLDENGMRMGPLPPMPSKETAYAERTQQESAPVNYSGQYEMPRQVYYEPPAGDYDQPTNYSNANYPTAGNFASLYSAPYYAAPYIAYYSPYYSYWPKMQFGHHFPNGEHSFPFHNKPGFQNCQTPSPRMGPRSSRR